MAPGPDAFASPARASVRPTVSAARTEPALSEHVFRRAGRGARAVLATAPRLRASGDCLYHRSRRVAGSPAWLGSRRPGESRAGGGVRAARLALV